MSNNKTRFGQVMSTEAMEHYVMKLLKIVSKKPSDIAASLLILALAEMMINISNRERTVELVCEYYTELAKALLAVDSQILANQNNNDNTT